MKKTIAVLFSIILASSCIVPVLAEEIKVPIDFSIMSIEELLSLDSAIHSEIESRSIEDDSQDEDPLLPSETMSAETDDGTVTMEEGETEISDESFMSDFSAGLIARWKIVDQDTSLMSDAEYIEFMRQCLNSELVYIEKYTEYEFEDSRLGEYAHAYINALQSQFIGITEYYGKDDELFDEYYTINGYRPRTRYIYLINKQYGIKLPSEYSATLKEMLDVGRVYDIAIPVTDILETELYATELSLDTSSSSEYLYITPFNIKNNGANGISNLTVKINFYDDNDVIIDSDYLVSYENVGKDKSVSTSKARTNNHFTHISYSYSFDVQTDMYYDTFEGTVVPAIQYSWDGTVKVDGQLADGQPVLEIQNIYSGWEMNTSWSNTLYVPVVKFDVRNVGTGEADRVVVKVVFTDDESKQIWDEVTTYVIASSDSPLKAGFSKKAFVYSSVGYKTNTVVTPNLTAEIYINDVYEETITISK